MEFIVIQSNKVLNTLDSDYSLPELQNVSETLSEIAYGIQLAAKIVDMPCNEMNVDHFIEVNILNSFCCFEIILRIINGYLRILCRKLKKSANY